MAQTSEQPLLLRLRLPLGDTHRLHVHPNASLDAVIEQAANSAGDCYGETFDSSKLWLSLNKRDPIVASSSTRIASCARRGDLVYLMGIQLTREVREALQAKLVAAGARQQRAAAQASAPAQSSAAASGARDDAQKAAAADIAAAEEDIMAQALLLSQQQEEWDFAADLVEAVELRRALLASMQDGMQDGAASDFACLDGASSLSLNEGDWDEVGSHSGMSASPENVSEDGDHAASHDKVEAASEAVAV